MPGRTHSTYSKQMTNDITMRVLSVLIENPYPMTISEICEKDICLTGITSQKITRSLTRLCEAGLIMKSKSKSKNRMVYVDAAALEKQGFDLDKVVC
jgi:predicted transcriptional regulator